MLSRMIAFLALGSASVMPSFGAGWDNNYKVDFVNFEVNGGCKCMEVRFKNVTSSDLRYYRYYYEQSGGSLEQAKSLMALALSAQQSGSVVNVLYTNNPAPASGWEYFSGLTVSAP